MNSISGIGSHAAAIQFGARRHQKPRTIIPMHTIIEKPETGDDDSIPENESPLPFSLSDRQEGDTIWINRSQKPVWDIAGGLPSLEPAQKRRSLGDSADTIVPPPPALTGKQSINPYHSSEISATSSPDSLEQSPERVARPWNIRKIRRLPMRPAGLMHGAEAPSAFKNSANPFLSPAHPQPNASQNTRPSTPDLQPDPN